MHKSGALPLSIQELDGRRRSPTPALASPLGHKKQQFHKHVISASREVNGKGGHNNFGQKRYSGAAFGGFRMTDSDYPRKSNLYQRKMQVLKIAAENYEMVKRLQRVQSSIGKRSAGTPSSRESRFSSRPKSS